MLLVTVGPMATLGLDVARLLEAEGIGATVVDPRWVVPVPQSVLCLSGEHRIVVTIEDGVVVGGIGTRVRQDLRAAEIDTTVTELGIPDEFIAHASRSQILKDAGLTAENIAANVIAQVRGTRIPYARPERTRK